jgi:hypothetical protein
MKPISHVLIEVCFISSRFSDHAIPFIEKGIDKKRYLHGHCSQPNIYGAFDRGYVSKSKNDASLDYFSICK